MSFLARLLLLWCSSLAMLSPVRAALPESEVRAAIVVNFVHYVEWPDNPAPGSELLICVAGQGATAEALSVFNGKSVLGRRIAVENRPYLASSASCRVLFIGETGARPSVDWLRDMTGQAVLTVSEGEDFLADGGVISLNRVGSRIAFDVNLTAMRRSNLRIGSQLLRLARDVHGK